MTGARIMTGARAAIKATPIDRPLSMHPND